MGFLQNIHRGENAIDFPKLWRISVVVSGVAVAASIIALIIGGLNLSIEFEGGTEFEVNAPGVSIDQARSALADVGEAGAKIQIVDGTKLRIQSELKDPTKAEEVKAKLAELGTVEAQQSVGPTWGDEITRKAIIALVVFFALLAAYISWRLEWRMAIGALVSVFHDVIVSVGAYAILSLVVSPATVVAFLTILGYSLYDTVVVYDKVRELAARPAVANRYTYTDTMNLALNQVLTRSIATTLAALIPVTVLLIASGFATGAVVLREMAVALFVGLLSGAYSSIFIAAPVVAWLKEREPRHRDVRQRLESRGQLADGTLLIDAREVGSLASAAGAKRLTGAAPAPAAAARTAAASVSTDERPAPTGAIPPRPRKKKRR